MKNRFSAILAVVQIMAIFATCAQAQSGYQPPSFLRNASGDVITAGVTPWILDIDSAGQIIGQQSKQFAHGDTFVIAPRVLDPLGNPRAWPTNTSFAMLYQSGSGMTSSNLWWLNGATATFPVYHDVQVTVSAPTIYSQVSTNQTVVYAKTYSNTTYLGVVATTTTVSSASFVTNYNRSLQTISVIDTGRVAIVFAATNDFGFDSYNCYLAGYGPNGRISQPVRFRMDFLPSPGLNAAIATQPINWITDVSNIIYSLTSQSVSNIQTYALRSTTNGAPANMWFIQTPIYP